MRIETAPRIDRCVALRRAVFVEELGVPDSVEFPGDEDGAIHLLALDGTVAVGTARVVIDGAVAKIGHLCVLPDKRSRGTGRALVRAAVAAARRAGATTVTLTALRDATALYAGEGFVPVGAPFEAAGLPHQRMERRW
ncbi:GNAT family N-acetyltransferase [Thalassococcus sp. CAU 1522]|uniref:GNAT family N-acetyltransferase n=1 Tax=Thalassococcus arenae TaxID=2851652 RepID=A0ABS6N7A9_9RHOB|nr:GNAT family N-acetyltransferase [Thalassococcus arenae]MBV2359683.1 GNAT family N-acetyltransferase [Thalassococcus arenae]